MNIEEFHKEKSILCNKHTIELKPLEKDLKKKKGVLKEKAEQILSEVLKRQKQELEDLNIKYRITPKKDQAENDLSVNQNTNLYYYPDRDWNSLSKKELEAEAVKRGLSKSGSKEDLCTSLILFQTSQAKKVADGLIDIKNTYPSSGGKASTNKKFDTADFVVEENTSKDRKQSGSHSYDGSHDEEGANGSENDDNREPQNRGNARKEFGKNKKLLASKHEGGGENEDGSEDMDIPDSQKILGSGRENSRAVHRRQYAYKNKGRRGGGANRASRSERVVTDVSNTASATSAEGASEEKLAKREKAVQTFLVKVLDNYPNGLKISHITAELEKLKVRNFRPELLGYDSLEEWITAQPPHLVQYDESRQLILPGKPDELPESDNDEDEFDE